MRISEDYKAGTYILTPANDEDTALVRDVLAQSPLNVLEYDGQQRASTDENMLLSFNIGGERAWVDCVSSYKGGISIVLSGSDEDSRDVIKGIRDMCFHGTGRLIVVEKESSTERLVCAGAFCSECGHPLIGLSASSLVCDECAEKCEHIFRPSVGMGYGFGQLVALDLCCKCHRASPESLAESKKLTRVERLAIAKERTGMNYLAIDDFGGMDVDQVLEFQNTGKLPPVYQARVDADPSVVPHLEALRQRLLADR